MKENSALQSCSINVSCDFLYYFYDDNNDKLIHLNMDDVSIS